MTGPFTTKSGRTSEQVKASATEAGKETVARRSEKLVQTIELPSAGPWLRGDAP